MNIAIVGTGYVGLVTGACLAAAGNQVVCIDSNTEKIASLVLGKVPFHEPELDELVHQCLQSRHLSFSADLAAGVRDAQLIFLAVGTPSAADGRADLSALLDCSRELAKTVHPGTVVVVKSTAPVGTVEKIQSIFDSRPHKYPAKDTVTVASNPEFLAEGSAVRDFRNPERIVVGTPSRRAIALLRELYAPFDPDGDRLLVMDTRSAELAKYACNAMLAARISMVNELSCIAGQLDADIRSICQVLKTDPRIGSRYLSPGAGYGGSCLPKDMEALINMAADHDEPASMLRSAQRVNQRQGQLVFQALSEYFSDGLKDRCIAVWGLAFKPGTDDVRAAPSVNLVRSLLAAGAHVRAYDPVATAAVRALIPDTELILTRTAQAACENADALMVMTEWDEFRDPDLDALARSLKNAAIFDGRHMYESAHLQKHHFYHYVPGQRRRAPDADADNLAWRGTTLASRWGTNVPAA